MKEKNLVNGYKALERLYAQKLPMVDAYKVYRLKGQVSDVYKFQSEQETKIIEEHHGTHADNGDISFPDELEFAKFRDAIIELNETEIDVPVDPVVIAMDHVKNINISPADIEALEGFVSFQ